MERRDWISRAIQIEVRVRNIVGVTEGTFHSRPYKSCRASGLSSQITTKNNGCVVILVRQRWYVNLCDVPKCAFV